MVRTIYTGPNNPRLGLATYHIYLEQFPENVLAAIKANPGLKRHFVDFEAFVAGRPPGAPPLGEKASVPAVRGTPIKTRGSGFIQIGKT